MSTSKKRKIEDVITDGSSLKLHRAGHVRSTLAAIVSGDSCQSPLSNRLLLIAEATFPNKDEWTLMYLVQLLAKEKEMSSEDMTNAWLSIAALIKQLSLGRTQFLLARTDFMSILMKYFRALHDAQGTTALDEISGMIRPFLNHRILRSLLLSPLEKACTTFVSLLNMFQARNSVNEALLSGFVDILLLSASRKSNVKRLRDVIRMSGLQAILEYLKYHEVTPSIRRLLSASLFNEAGCMALDELKPVLRSSGLPTDLQRFCHASFECVSDATKNTNKRLLARNALLRLWLSVSTPDCYGTLFTSYHATQGDLHLNRALSADTELQDSMRTVITHALSPTSSDAQLLRILLKIDLDLFMPDLESAVWSLIERTKDSELLLEWLKVFVELRSLPKFLGSALQLISLSTEIVDQNMMNIIAYDIQHSAVTIQEDAFKIALRSSATLSEPLLTAVIAGLAPDAKILLENIDMLKAKISDSRLARVLALKISAFTDLMHLTCRSKPPLDNYHAAETWLRIAEVELASDGQISNLDSIQADDILDIATANNQFLNTLVTRWALPFSKFLGAEGKKRFVALICEASSADSPLIASPALLEVHDLHAAIQEHLTCNCDDRMVSLMLKLPLDFLHKAVRKQVVERFMREANHSAGRCELLLKYAEADLLPRFATAHEFISFANLLLASELSLRDQKHWNEERSLIYQRLREMCMKTLTDDQCRAIQTSAECHDLIRVELLQERGALCSDLSAIVSEMLTRSVPILLQTEITLRDVFLHVRIVLKLLQFRNQAVSSFEDLNLVSALPSVMAWVLLAETQSSVATTGMILQIAGWLTTCANEALDIFQSQAFLRCETQKINKDILVALTKSLPGAELESLLALETLTASDASVTRCNQLLSLALLSEAEKRLSPEFMVSQVISVCETTHAISDSAALESTLDFLQLSLSIPNRAFTEEIVDHICIFAQRCLALFTKDTPSSTHLKLHKVFRAMFQHQTGLLRDRYHELTFVFQLFLDRTLQDVGSADVTSRSFVRLFETFLSAGRGFSATPEHFNRAFAKHAPWLLIEYVSLFTRTTATTQFSSKARSIITEGFAYMLMGLCGQHEREMIGNSLDAPGRGMFKKLYEEWDKFGKWTEK